MRRILYYSLVDLLRSRVLLVYTVLTFIMGMTMFSLQGYEDKALLSLVSFMLIAIPLMSLMFTTIYLYNSDEFMLMLIAQPVKRGMLLRGSILALAIGLGLATAIGIGIPILINHPSVKGLVITLIGVILSWVFVSMSALAYVLSRDKARGIGIAILLWIYFALLYDSLALTLFYAFSDYPLEPLMITLSACNPIDLARLLIVLQLDASALMGFSAAVFRDYLGSPLGYFFAILLLVLWIVIPSILAVRIFRTKDL